MADTDKPITDRDRLWSLLEQIGRDPSDLSANVYEMVGDLLAIYDELTDDEREQVNTLMRRASARWWEQRTVE